VCILSKHLPSFKRLITGDKDLANTGAGEIDDLLENHGDGLPLGDGCITGVRGGGDPIPLSPAISL